MVDDRHAKISQRAYEIWESHGKPHGKHAEHWAAATKAVDEASKPAKGPRGRSAKAKAAETVTAAPEAPAKKPRAKAAKPAAHAEEPAKAEPAKTEPAKTEAERHVEKPAAGPKPKRAKKA